MQYVYVNSNSISRDFESVDIKHVGEGYGSGLGDAEKTVRLIVARNGISVSVEGVYLFEEGDTESYEVSLYGSDPRSDVTVSVSAEDRRYIGDPVRPASRQPVQSQVMEPAARVTSESGDSYPCGTYAVCLVFGPGNHTEAKTVEVTLLRDIGEDEDIAVAHRARGPDEYMGALRAVPVGIYDEERPEEKEIGRRRGLWGE